jgi:hypothetical protein
VEKVRNVYKILVVITKGISPLGRPRRRWEDNVKMDLKEGLAGFN